MEDLNKCHLLVGFRIVTDTMILAEHANIKISEYRVILKFFNSENIFLNKVTRLRLELGNMYIKIYHFDTKLQTKSISDREKIYISISLILHN